LWGIPTRKEKKISGKRITAGVEGIKTREPAKKKDMNRRGGEE